MYNLTLDQAYKSLYAIEAIGELKKYLAELEPARDFFTEVKHEYKIIVQGRVFCFHRRWNWFHRRWDTEIVDFFSPTEDDGPTMTPLF